MLLLVFAGLAISSIAARGQTPAQAGADAAAATSGQTSGQNSAQPAPAKKVWTNEDVSGLRADSVISTFSAPNAKPSASGPRPASKGKDAKWYQAQISKLQAKIPPLNDQIDELQAAIDGKPTGNGTESARPRGVKADSWPVEMDHLKKQRDAVEGQIGDLYDQARRDGIPSNALPLQQ